MKRLCAGKQYFLLRKASPPAFQQYVWNNRQLKPSFIFLRLQRTDNFKRQQIAVALNTGRITFNSCIEVVLQEVLKPDREFVQMPISEII